ncbi:hypothetical protein ACW9I6_02670 [Pseudomonas sp. SDO5522_S412]
MSAITSEELNAKLDELETKLPKLDGVKNSFWKTTTQCQTLLSESGATTKPVKVTGAAKRFTPNGLFYLEYLSFNGAAQKLVSNLTIIIKPINEPSFTLKLTSSKDATFAFGFVRKFCEWFEIYSNAIISKPLLTKINVYGTDSSQLTSLSKDIEYVINARDTFDSFKEQFTKEHLEALEKTEQLKNKTTELVSNIAEYQAELSELESSVIATKAKNAEENSKLQKIKLDANHFEERKTLAFNNVSQLTETAEELNKKISTMDGELKKLTSDKNLISDEYGPYVKEGKSQAKVYSALLTIPLLTIFFAIYQIYIGASNLLNASYQSPSDIFAAFILRIPFAAIFGLAIFYCWKISSAMIQKIFKIHGDRLTLAKLLVVARETVHSSAKNLNITDHEKFQEQNALKIEVLKSHMAKDLTDSFTYRPVTTFKESPAQPVQDAVNDDSAVSEKQI